MRRQITGSVRAGESTIRVAERLLDIDAPIVRLPKHVAELKKAARMALEAGDRNIYNEAVKRWSSTIERLGQGAPRRAGAYTMRSATQQLVKDLDKAKLEQLDQVVDRWVLDRARYQARTIARTEVVDGFRDVYQKSSADQPYTKGFRFVLSASHPRPDVCDVYASQDLYGLGPGGYPADSVPSTPHPRCMCSRIAITDTHHFRRELAKAKGQPVPPEPWKSGKHVPGAEWLRAKPEAFQKKLLGPTRFKAFRLGRRVLDDKGVPIPVHQVIGIPKPTRKDGPAVAAKPIIRRDRATMVKPFPTVSPSRR